ncbi:MAG: hypothetical protein ACYSWZ_12740 [Planctomycetota bacterium]|jgi:hypothetical protein
MIRRLLPSPIAFVLSIEIGLPFLELSWPWSLIIGVFFVLSNRATEKICLQMSKYRKKLVILAAGALINTLIFTFFCGNFARHFLSLIKSLHINTLQLQAALGIALSIMCLLLFMRCVALLIECWWDQFKKIKEKGKCAPTKNSIQP